MNNKTSSLTGRLWRLERKETRGEEVGLGDGWNRGENDLQKTWGTK